jgi:hypothetical protein
MLSKIDMKIQILDTTYLYICKSDVGYITTGEWTFSEFPVLPRVSKIGHSGKKNTRGREASPSAIGSMALGEERHSGKALFPECNTRGRDALADENWYLTAEMDGATLKTLLPECHPQYYYLFLVLSSAR